MSSLSKSITVLKDIDTVITVKAKGYYDKSVKARFSENGKTESIELAAYDGLSYQFQKIETLSPLSADISVTKLPDGSLADPMRGCLMPYADGKVYYDVSVAKINADVEMSGVTIDDNNQLTMQGSTSIFNVNSAIPESDDVTKIEIIIKANLTSPATSQILVKNTIGNITLAQAYVQSTKKYRGYFNKSAVGGSTILEDGKTYWFAVVEDLENITGYLLEDNGEYTADTLPAYDQWLPEWTLPVTKYANTFKGGTIVFFNNNNQYWRSTVDLNNTKIKLTYSDGSAEDWWYWNKMGGIYYSANGLYYNYEDTSTSSTTVLNCFRWNNTYVLTADESIADGVYLGQVSVPPHQVYQYSETYSTAYDANYEKIGSVEVGKWDGMAYGFGTTSYLYTNYMPPVNFTTPWTMKVRVAYVKYSGVQYCFGCYDYVNGPTITITSKYFVAAYISGTNVTTKTLIDNEALENGDLVDIELSYDGNGTFSLRYQRNESGTWKEVGTYTTTENVTYSDNLAIGAGTTSGRYNRGTILLPETKFLINGVETWSAARQQGFGSWSY